MARSLPRDDHRVELHQVIEQGEIRRRDALVSRAECHLGAENRVVLSQWRPSLDLETGGRLAGDTMEEDGLVHRGDERVADAAQHGMVRPHHQRIPPFGHATHVVSGVFSEPLHVSAGQRIGHRGIGAPASFLHVGECDLRLPAYRVIPILVHPEYGVEDLQRRVGVESGRDFRDHVEVLVDEAAQACVVIHRATSGPARDEQFIPRNAERILAVHEKQTDPRIIV